MRISTSLSMKDWNAVPPDNDIGVENLAGIDVALHDGLECVSPDNNGGVEVLTDTDIALHDGLECVATRKPTLE